MFPEKSTSDSLSQTPTVDELAALADKLHAMGRFREAAELRKLAIKELKTRSPKADGGKAA